jgi:uncharacterized protein YjbI with pentapeptide repeats
MVAVSSRAFAFMGSIHQHFVVIIHLVNHLAGKWLTIRQRTLFLHGILSAMKRTLWHGIHLPQLPKPLAALPGGDLEDAAVFAQGLLDRLDWSGSRAADLVFEQVHLRRLNLQQTHWQDVRLSDCRLELCDFSAAEWTTLRCRRVEFNGCRLLGAALAENHFEDVYFKDCLAERVNFTWAVVKGARFEKCDLRGASFIGVDLSGVVFQDCDLSGADLREARLTGADLRTCAIDGLKVGTQELRGVILAPHQALQVMGLLGIEIKNLDEDLS